MTEPLSELIRLRITPSHYQKLTEAAALAGLSLSEYLRRILSTVEHYQADRSAIHNTERAAMEALLILRQTIDAQSLAQVHEQLVSRGVSPLPMED
ncbi:hypothetical protein H0A71_19810 [Alcaligenaceae bacterium]|nr:hypothetical protein [Alcaligenaceae bacterium]